MSDPLGGLPQAPPPSEGYRNLPASRGPAPSPVVNAVRLMFLTVILSVIGTIVLLATKDSFKKQILESNPATSDQTINSVIAIAVVISVVILVLFVLLALQVRKGKNWARITTWVFSGLGLLGGLSNLVQAGTGITHFINVLSLIIYAAIIILLALTPSNHYFKPRY